MATAPNLVVAGHPGVARKLRGTGWFPVVFDVVSASQLRDLSKSGKVGSSAAFVFAPWFDEDLPGAGVAVLANGLARAGFTVLVHADFTERGEVFDPKVVTAAKKMTMSDLLAAVGVVQPEPQSELQPEPPPEPWTVPGSPPARPAIEARVLPQRSAGAEAAPRPVLMSSEEWQRRPGTARVNTQIVADAAQASPVGDSVEHGIVIAVASAKGGVGKTSTTVRLAVLTAKLLQKAGRTGSAVVVDANFRQADVARYLNLKSPTILDLLQAPGALSAQAVRHNLAHVPEVGLYALLGPPDAVSVDPSTVNSTLYRRILTALRQTFDFVFVDTPVAEPYKRTFADLILPEADAILVPLEANRVTLEAVRSWLSAITMPQHSRVPQVSAEKIFMILNRARPDVECGPEEVMDRLRGWRFVGLIPEDEGWIRAVNNRQLMSQRFGPDLERTLRGILRDVSGDPVFEGLESRRPDGVKESLKKLLTPKLS
ncbi:AAA family ATPase [Actinoallomurus sp. NBC_01490]|uniref:AAA family ATPase n=1 Tax=Actinoallomurus sp. NBC_01490 TaxID=2903557 RepID=UPI002E2F3174|nr:AAA family ATPase [Actinoallomurus sp. NBC_01490]